MAEGLKILYRAISRNEMDKLLLGYPEYCYRSRWSPAPENTDLTELIGIIYDTPKLVSNASISKIMETSLFKTLTTFDGLAPVASCILLESSYKYDHRPILNLPLETLAKELKSQITKFTKAMDSDTFFLNTEKIEDLQRLSKIVVELGGPSFLE